MGCFKLWIPRRRFRRSARTPANSRTPRDSNSMSGEKSSLADEPPAYAAPGYQVYGDEKRDAVVRTIETTIDDASADLRDVSLAMFDHPELAYKEKYAHDLLTKFMRSQGFEVTEHAFGLETAWSATFQHGHGGRTIGVNSEMDALPGVGHACGHPLIAIVGVSIALALKKALVEHDVAGKVVLLGTPAEENGAGKIKLIDAGAYKEMDICLMAHPGPGPAKTAGTGSSLAIRVLNVEFFGHTSHASAAPWEGQNALDAAVLVYNAVSMLRQQTPPDHRVHGIIIGRDWASNIIPDYAKMKYIVRAPRFAQAEILHARVMNCFKAAGLATSCKVETTNGEDLYDLVQNDALAAEFASVSKALYDVQVGDAPGAIGGSTDFGNVTYAVPALHPSFAIPTAPGNGNHTPGFTEWARKPAAHEAALVVAKGLAVVGWKAIVDDAFFGQVREAFERQVGLRNEELAQVQQDLAANA
ncbi:amidohydrolase [Auriculariales sp. MPI-PUGE-AT-0066]|nr:amidohydrolase [Auriculariales sp. MPI-PUGE-AT-0066]